MLKWTQKFQKIRVSLHKGSLPRSTLGKVEGDWLHYNEARYALLEMESPFWCKYVPWKMFAWLQLINRVMVDCIQKDCKFRGHRCSRGTRIVPWKGVNWINIRKNLYNLIYQSDGHRKYSRFVLWFVGLCDIHPLWHYEQITEQI